MQQRQTCNIQATLCELKGSIDVTEGQSNVVDLMHKKTRKVVYRANIVLALQKTKVQKESEVFRLLDYHDKEGSNVFASF